MAKPRYEPELFDSPSDTLLLLAPEVGRTDSLTGAFSHLGSKTYDLVVADARLQDGTGMDVANRAQEHGIRTLIVGGYAFSYPELREHEFLLKPVRPNELLNEIERLLGSAP